MAISTVKMFAWTVPSVWLRAKTKRTRWPLGQRVPSIPARLTAWALVRSQGQMMGLVGGQDLPVIFPRMDGFPGSNILLRGRSINKSRVRVRATCASGNEADYFYA